MPASNFPYGFAQGLTVRGMPVLNAYPGNVYWVDSTTAGNSDQNPGTLTLPMATLAGALNRCVAGNGDIIMLGAGHAETITNATALIFSVAGVAIIGMGTGGLRPTFTFATNTTANIPVTAANISIQNVVFLSTKASVASVFTATGTATPTDFCIDNCEFRDTSTTLNFLAVFTTNSTASSWDGFTMTNCKFLGTGTATKTMIISTIGCDRLVVTDNLVTTMQTTVAMLMTTAATSNTNCYIARNKAYGAHTSSSLACGISGTGTAWSGIAENNLIFSLASGTGIWIPTTTKLGMFNNYSPIAGAYATQGTLNPLAT